MGVGWSSCCLGREPPPSADLLGVGAVLGDDDAGADWSGEPADFIKSLTTLSVGPSGSFTVYNLDLSEGEARTAQLQSYYEMCRRAAGVHVTTSCFKTWRQHRKTNAYGKAIPTASFARATSSPQPLRVFFFDDNLELDGSESSSGICNLRDVHTGEYVDFTVGRNGFLEGRAGRHTVIHHSTEYNSVLVKANILDAIEDPEYFLRIIKAYSAPDEKSIVYMDVNSTIVCNDSVQSKDLSASLLSIMFELMVLVPRSSFEFGWGTCAPVSVKKRCSLKKLVKDITAQDYGAYKSFFSEANCRSFFRELATLADVRWSDAEENLTEEDFVQMFEGYRETISEGVDVNGITQSWFRCVQATKTNNVLMLNSFGVDTRKVVLATVTDESKVTQIAINHELWDKPDVDKFEEQFSESTPS